jgi:hypothetical protein
MARRRDPTARSILKALKIDPIREIAEHALTLEKGSAERLELMWQLVPWIHHKPRAPIEAAEGSSAVVVVEIGGDE